jgi:penicillin-binding protein 1A
VTGGSLPVEVWSRFMRGAHQGVPVASLPGSAPSGGLFSGLFGGSSAPSAPVASSAPPIPPAPIQPAASRASTTGSGGGLDGWLLNNLFGRR